MTAPHRWTADEFFHWREDEADRYEPVSGLRGPTRAGARNVHDDIVVNLRGSAWRPATGRGSVETRLGQIMRPGVEVETNRLADVKPLMPGLLAALSSAVPGGLYLSLIAIDWRKFA
jgi:hypothetical protein